MPNYPTGTRWLDKDDRVWAVTEPGVFTLEGQETILRHNIEHVVTEFGPLVGLVHTVDDVLALSAQNADAGDETPVPVPKHVTDMYMHLRKAADLLDASYAVGSMGTLAMQTLAATQAVAHLGLAQLASVGIIPLVDNVT